MSRDAVATPFSTRYHNLLVPFSFNMRIHYRLVQPRITSATRSRPGSDTFLSLTSLADSTGAQHTLDGLPPGFRRTTSHLTKQHSNTRRSFPFALVSVSRSEVRTTRRDQSTGWFIYIGESPINRLHDNFALTTPNAVITRGEVRSQKWSEHVLLRRARLG